MSNVTDHEITEAMIRFGGSFVTKLGQLFRAADTTNQARVKAAFPKLWKQYAELAWMSAKERA